MGLPTKTPTTSPSKASLCHQVVSISSGATAQASLNSYLAAWTSGTYCNGTVLFTVSGASFSLTSAYTIRRYVPSCLTPGPYRQ